MFFAGDPSFVADYYYDKARALSKGRLRPKHWEEMSTKELKAAIATLRLAWKLAEQDNCPREVMDMLEQPYEEVFRVLCAVSKSFRDHAINNPGGRDEKYHKIALSAS